MTDELRLMEIGFYPFNKMNEERWDIIRSQAAFGFFSSFQKARDFVETMPFPLDELYVTTGMTELMLYDGDWAILEVMPFPNARVLTQWSQLKTKIAKAIAEKDYYAPLVYAPNALRMFLVMQHINDIEDNEEKRALILNVRQSAEYDFANFDEEVAIPWLQEHYTEQATDLLALAKRHPQDRLTVYRGEGSKSTFVEEAHSWTLDKNRAVFFATRFDEEGIVYTGTVARSDVMAYLEGEEEVLVSWFRVFDVCDDTVSRRDLQKMTR